MLKFILSAILLIFPVLNTADDIDKGYQAYKQQKYLDAYQYWIIPAHNGDEISQYNIALLYFFGNGVEKNNKKAVRWFKLGFSLIIKSFKALTKEPLLIVVFRTLLSDNFQCFFSTNLPHGEIYPKAIFFVN